MQNLRDHTRDEIVPETVDDSATFMFSPVTNTNLYPRSEVDSTQGIVDRQFRAELLRGNIIKPIDDARVAGISFTGLQRTMLSTLTVVDQLKERDKGNTALATAKNHILDCVGIYTQQNPVYVLIAEGYADAAYEQVINAREKKYKGAFIIEEF